jgi:hypothetical protein
MVLVVDIAPTDALSTSGQRNGDGYGPTEPRMPWILDLSRFSTMGVALSTCTTACCLTRRFVGRRPTKCTSAPVARCPRTWPPVRPRPVGLAVKRTDRRPATPAGRPTWLHDHRTRTVLPRPRSQRKVGSNARRRLAVVAMRTRLTRLPWSQPASVHRPGCWMTTTRASSYRMSRQTARKIRGAARNFP